MATSIDDAKGQEDATTTRKQPLKAVRAAAVAAITSQLISVIFATNAINRLTEHAGTAETMATGVADLLTKDLFVQFWLGVYIHFIIGILGMLGMVAFRAWFFMGAAYNRAM